MCNVRLTYQDINKNGIVENTEILNESNYYPFGLKHGHYNQLANNFSNSLLPNAGFNGQPNLIDLDANLLLMDFRLYDNALGRFFGIDLLADMFTDQSPYHFGYNNPISFMDPLGLAFNGGNDDGDLLDEIIINYTPPQIPPGGGFTVPILFFDNWYDQVGIYNPNNPDDGTVLPEIIIDSKPKEQEAKNGYSNLNYTPPPKEIPGFPGAEKLRNKKGWRPAWRLPNGELAEWDSQEAELEVYDKTGKKHKGAYDPDTGKKKSEGKKERKASRAKFDIPYESYNSPYRYIRPQSPVPASPNSAYATGAIIIIMILLIPIGV